LKVLHVEVEGLYFAARMDPTEPVLQLNILRRVILSWFMKTLVVDKGRATEVAFRGARGAIKKTRRKKVPNRTRVNNVLNIEV